MDGLIDANLSVANTPFFTAFKSGYLWLKSTPCKGKNQSQQGLGVPSFPLHPKGHWYQETWEGLLIHGPSQSSFSGSRAKSPASRTDTLRHTTAPRLVHHYRLTLGPLGIMATYTQNESQDLNWASNFIWLVEIFLSLFLLCYILPNLCMWTTWKHLCIALPSVFPGNLSAFFPNVDEGSLYNVLFFWHE